MSSCQEVGIILASWRPTTPSLADVSQGYIYRAVALVPWATTMCTVASSNTVNSVLFSEVVSVHFLHGKNESDVLHWIPHFRFRLTVKAFSLENGCSLWLWGELQVEPFWLPNVLCCILEFLKQLFIQSWTAGKLNLSDQHPANTQEFVAKVSGPSPIACVPPKLEHVERLYGDVVVTKNAISLNGRGKRRSWTRFGSKKRFCKLQGKENQWTEKWIRDFPICKSWVV